MTTFCTSAILLLAASAQGEKYLRNRVIQSRNYPGNYSINNITNIIINGQGATFVFGYLNWLRKWVAYSIELTFQNPLERENVCEPPSPSKNFHFYTPPPLETSVTLCGGGMDIFWNHTVPFPRYWYWTLKFCSGRKPNFVKATWLLLGFLATHITITLIIICKFYCNAAKLNFTKVNYSKSLEKLSVQGDSLEIELVTDF